MAIFVGLIQKNLENSSLGNAYNELIDNTNRDIIVSTVWTKSMNNFFSYRRKPIDRGINYPRNSISKPIGSKDFSYKLYVYDGATNELMNTNEVDYEILYKNNAGQNYITKKYPDFFEIKFQKLKITNNINLTIRIRKDGYLNQYAQIGSIDRTETYEQHVYLIDIDNPPDGVHVVDQTLEQNENGTTQEYILTFPESSSRSEWSTITIPQNTKFYDKENNLLTGNLRIVAGHFSPSHDVSLSMFGPGWNVPNIESDTEGNNFISKGFYSIEVFDSNNNIAKSLA